MATPEEIEQRVEEADATRSARRAAAAREVAELAQRRSGLAEQLEVVERQLGDVITGARDVMGIDELARFTDLPATDLTRWLTGRKPSRGPRRKTTKPVAPVVPLAPHSGAPRESTAAAER
ncbi:hypothetical protein [Saccharothrix variisporea]|uniref:Uncharacterized protein n=1 Tax=Saccharothrix variisporea TaxID=543527 RepID=A0A495XA44_9PSEU|nr:hypothetical protein [Saccharothrix variisporea]RKT69483.1 hypothetical protein DFJ66_2713 [Saccharothrix variisporea]